jgi:Domain of unknown function (DUF4397)
MTKMILKIGALLFTVVMFVACSKDTITTPPVVLPTTAQIRVVNLTEGFDSLNLSVDAKQLTTSGIKFNTSSSFFTIDGGNRTIKMDIKGSNVSSGIFNILKDSAYTFYTYNDNDGSIIPKGRFFIENTTPPATDKARVTMFHLSPDAQAVDIEFVATGGVATKNSQFTNLNFKNQSPSVELTAHSYDIKVKIANTTNVITTIPINLTSGKIYSVFVRGYSAKAGSIGATVVSYN